jgi:hypothetical protein
MSLKKYFNDLLDYFQGADFQQDLEFSVTQGKDKMVQRIFNSQEGGKDIKGKTLGSYSDPYAAFRERTGRQGKKKDFDYNSSLRGSIRVGSEDNTGSVFIENAFSQELAGYLTVYQKEKKSNLDIFAFSEEENEYTKQFLDELVVESITKIGDNNGS